MLTSEEEPIRGLMDQVGQTMGGMMGGQSGQNLLLQAIAGILGKDSSIGGLTGLVQAVSAKRPGEIVNSWVTQSGICP